MSDILGLRAAGSAGRINLPGGWYLIRDDEDGPHYRCWFLSEPGGVWVAKFWDGPKAGESDAVAFAMALGVQSGGNPGEKS